MAVLSASSALVYSADRGSWACLIALVATNVYDEVAVARQGARVTATVIPDNGLRVVGISCYAVGHLDLAQRHGPIDGYLQETVQGKLQALLVKFYAHDALNGTRFRFDAQGNSFRRP